MKNIKYQIHWKYFLSNNKKIQNITFYTILYHNKKCLSNSNKKHILNSKLIGNLGNQHQHKKGNWNY